MEAFWSLVEEVWSESSFGVSPAELLTALAVFLVFAVLRGLFTRFVLGGLERLTKRTETEIDDLLREALERPIKFFFLILGVFFALEVLPLDGLAAELADKIMRSLIAVGIFWSFYAASTPASMALKRIEDVLSPEIVGWLLTLLRWGIVLTGLATILQIWGIQIAPIIAGFGLFGVAVALGAQDLFKNLLGGVSILIERRFKLGDWIEVESVVEGNIEQIGFRSTRVRRFDQVPVVVPNNMFSDHALVNYSNMTRRRIKWTIGLEYRTTAAQLKQVREGILAWLDSDPRFVTEIHEVPNIVHIDGFNDSSIDMLVYCFTETTKWYDWLSAKEDLALAIKTVVEDAGTGFAFPSRSIYMENDGVD
ncbi:MAG: mechanosensitive ion channel family protein [Alphaproteobacteria bacterium]|nr:mechanosensitive ion channel family protein [Alphaproteobacteria bacterium]